MPAPSSRTVAISAAAAALGTLVPVALFQLRAVGKLPDPPGPWFASERITMSKAARPLGIPDGLLGLGSYGATFALLLASGRVPWASKLLIGKLSLDGAMAGFNMVKQVASFRKLCSWCTGTALATAVLVPAGLRYTMRLHDGKN